VEFVLREEAQEEEISPSDPIHQTLSLQSRFMSEPRWVMFRCESCVRFSGAKKGQKSMVCGHCGSRERLSIVQEFNDSQSMANAVSMENTPPEIRNELESILKGKRDMFSNPISRPVDPLELIQSATDENGMIDVESLIIKSNTFDVPRSIVLEWLEQSEIEGMVLRLPSGKFRLL